MTARGRHIAWVLALVFLVSAGQAFAGPIGTTGNLTWVRQSGFYSGTSGGGEFTAYNYTGVSNADYSAVASNMGNYDPSFQTFCLEAKESAVNTNRTLYFVVGSAAVYGGTTGSSDTLSRGTAWLYSQFAQGALEGYPAAGPRGTWSNDLQNAIWAFEGEQGGVQNALYNLALSNVQDATVDSTPGFLGVYVLNNFSTAAARDAFVASQGTVISGVKQDFLYFQAPVPDGGATLMLLGGALVGLGALRRKFDR